MKHVAYIQQFRNVMTSITCDCCKKTYDVEDDFLEVQEFMSWSDTGGYGNSTFGDMYSIEIDLCQYCVKTLLGDYIRTRNTLLET